VGVDHAQPGMDVPAVPFGQRAAIPTAATVPGSARPAQTGGARDRYSQSRPAWITPATAAIRSDSCPEQRPLIGMRGSNRPLTTSCMSYAGGVYQESLLLADVRTHGG
jgi:hypothetical protein